MLIAQWLWSLIPYTMCWGHAPNSGQIGVLAIRRWVAPWQHLSRKANSISQLPASLLSAHYRCLFCIMEYLFLSPVLLLSLCRCSTQPCTMIIPTNSALLAPPVHWAAMPKTLPKKYQDQRVSNAGNSPVPVTHLYECPTQYSTLSTQY